MQIDYDPRADVMYIQLRPGEVDYTREMASDFFVDIDQKGTPVGIEILSVRRLLAQKEPVSVILNIDSQAEVFA